MFSKLPSQPRAILPLGQPVTFYESPRAVQGNTSQRPTEIPSKRHDRQTKDLTRRFPELQPASKLLRPLLQASEAVEGATSRHDPVTGQRLDFGQIFDESLRRSARVAAFASGPSGSDVRVVQAQLQKQGWADSRDIWIEVPVFAGEESVWHSDAAPVQQVCFAKPIDSGECLLAVRMITRTVILKPVLRKAGPGRLDVNELCEVRMSQTGHVPHAHVTFNPWFTRQFAIVDQTGNWSLWEFGNREARTAAESHSCRDDAGSLASDNPLNDGWARIAWIYDPNTILLATRDEVSLYAISAGPQKIEKIDVGVRSDAGWILDISLLPGHIDKLCILTSTHLQIMVVHEDGNQVQTRTMLHIRHQRSPEDITLGLTAWEDGEGKHPDSQVIYY